MKIGLTGSIACGKSTVSAYLKTLGYPVVDADAISRALTAPGGMALPLLREAFGDGIFDGEVLSRPRLSTLVFSDAQARERLNALLHPLIIKAMTASLCAQDTPGGLVFGDVPLLFECGLSPLFDRVWVVHCRRQTQIDRLFTRDGLDAAQAAQRVDTQMPLDEKMRLADALIDTDAPMEAVQAQVCALLGASGERRHA